MKKNPHIIFASLPNKMQDDLRDTDKLVQIMFTPSFNNIKPKQKDLLISHLEYFAHEQKKLRSKKTISRFMCKLIQQKKDRLAYEKSVMHAIVIICMIPVSIVGFIFQNLIFAEIVICAGLLIANPILTLATSFLLCLSSLIFYKGEDSTKFKQKHINYVKSENIEKEPKIESVSEKSSKVKDKYLNNVKISLKY